MRGFKAKVLRRIALQVEKDNTPGYIYPKGRRHNKVYIDALGAPQMYSVSGQAILASQADRLYNRMKKDLANGGT